MNRKGFLRIIEASISIVILIGVIFFLFLQTRPEAIGPNYDEMARDLLEEISRNSSLRNAVLVLDENKISNFLDRRIQLGSFRYDFTICEVDEVCGLDNYIEGEVFAQERVISSDVTHGIYAPKKLRLFIWRK